MATKHYINQKEFYNEIVISKERGELTKRALDMFILLSENLSWAVSYKNPDDRDDCKSGGLMDMYLYWRNFDPAKSTNAFAYFTQVCKMGMAKTFKKLHTEVDKGKVSIDKETGIYNI